MNNRDPRVRRTADALAKALIALTLERGYEAITIRDLAERAGIGPATFYRHYPHKDALLSDVLDLFVGELLALLPRPAAGAKPQAEGALIFRYIEAHQALARVLLASEAPGTLVARLQALSAAHQPAARRARATGRVPPEIAAHHMVAASLALIQWWLENDLPYPPEKMGEVYAALVVEPAQS